MFWATFPEYLVFSWRLCIVLHWGMYRMFYYILSATQIRCNKMILFKPQRNTHQQLALWQLSVFGVCEVADVSVPQTKIASHHGLWTSHKFHIIPALYPLHYSEEQCEYSTTNVVLILSLAYVPWFKYQSMHITRFVKINPKYDFVPCRLQILRHP